jgi:hypothetical protein
MNTNKNKSNNLSTKNDKRYTDDDENAPKEGIELPSDEEEYDSNYEVILYITI